MLIEKLYFDESNIWKWIKRVKVLILTEIFPSVQNMIFKSIDFKIILKNVIIEGEKQGKYMQSRAYTPDLHDLRHTWGKRPLARNPDRS